MQNQDTAKQTQTNSAKKSPQTTAPGPMFTQDDAQNQAMGKMTLGKKLVSIFLALSIIPVLAIGITNYFEWSSVLEESTYEHLSTLAESKESMILLYFKGLITQVLAASKDEFISECLTLSNKNATGANKAIEELNNYLKIKASIEKDSYEIFVIDPKGKVIAGTDKAEIGLSKLEDPYFIGGQKGAYIKDVYLSKTTGKTGFAVSAPIKDFNTGEFLGVIVHRHTLATLNRITAEYGDEENKDAEAKAQKREIYLVNKDGFMITESKTVKDAPLKQKISNELVTLYHTQDKLSQGIYENYRGVQVVGVSEGNYLKRDLNLDWVMISEVEKDEVFSAIYKLRNMLIVALVITVIIVLIIAVSLSNSIAGPIRELSGLAAQISKGDLDVDVEIKSRDEVGHLASSFKNMAQNLKTASAERDAQDWLKTGQTELSDKMRGDLGISDLAQNIVTYLAAYMNAQIGAIYMNDGNGKLKLIGSYAYTKRKNLSSEFNTGEGLVGQAALEKHNILINNVPDDYIRITSGLGEAVPHNILVMPFMFGGEVKGVIELGSFDRFNDLQMEFLNQIDERVAVAFNTVQGNIRTKDLLEETQRQAEELQAQQEELRSSNEELEEQTRALKESEAKLQAQQEELQSTNEELEERSEALEKQRLSVQQKNAELQKAQTVIEEKAAQLELTSKYKSEFLANMSHELRTPLNSLLLLSKHLSENKEGNLVDKQVEYARAIHSSGNDLLTLINDVLDLSKVESGKMDLNLEDLPLSSFAAALKKDMAPLVQKNKLVFEVKIAEGMPTHIHTDSQKLNQVVKNLLSNAIKFTPEGGSVGVNVFRAENNAELADDGLDLQNPIGISVTDTGIGIPKEKQRIIFEAFQQADGSTSRKYGGTGLGLSISRELAKLLGGVIKLKSVEGEGSAFTLYIPENLKEKPKTEAKREPEAVHVVPVRRLADEARAMAAAASDDPPAENDFVPDDKKDLQPRDKCILVIEDDQKFAKILRDLAHEKGFKCLVAGDGETGIHFADYYKPSAVLLDVSLPGIDGWGVMKRLKENIETRGIPVYFITATEKKMDALRMGAVGYLTKPVSQEKLDGAFSVLEDTISRKVKKVLILEDDEEKKNNVLKLIKNSDIETKVVSSCKEAYEQIKSEKFDSLILNPRLSQESGFDLLEEIKHDKAIASLPIIIYASEDLSEQEKAKLHKYRENITIKEVKSPEMLLDEVTLFLHLIEENLPKEQRKILRMIHDRDAALKGKRILLVDDDVRNVFALSTVLEDKGMQIMAAKTGKEGLDLLSSNPNIDLILMDIMLPEMSGYEVIGKIKQEEKFKNIPIIAITAKAMKGDRKKCIDAGANDYISKPVDMDKLLSLLRVWLYNRV